MKCPNCGIELSDTDVKCPECAYDIESGSIDDEFPHALKTGTILNGCYIIESVIAQGGFGITYLATEYNSNDKVAIKEYLPEELATRKEGENIVVPFIGERGDSFNYGKDSFFNEAKMLSKFRTNPNIVRVDKYFEENGTAYFVMEYVDGMSLNTYLKEKNKGITIAEANRIFLPLISALGEVHAEGLIHRDIAPDNIIIANNGKTKLIDFGAARYSVGEKSKSLDVILKHGFAPLEQYSRHSEQGSYTDVYALAATYYYAITGAIPPDSIDRLDGDTLLLPSKLGKKINKDLEAVLLKALSVQPDDRYQGMDEFAEAIKSSIKKKNRKKRALLISLLAIVIAIISAFFALVIRPRDNTYRKAVEEYESNNLKEAVELFGGLNGYKDSEEYINDYNELMDKIEEGERLYKEYKYSEALPLFMEAAERGNSYAQYYLGEIYYDGNNDIEKDYAKAFEWFSKSAEQGDGFGQAGLGSCYYYGRNVEKDYKKALELFTKSAEQNNPLGQAQLGYCYFEGKAVEEDFEKAAELYSKSAEQDYALGQALLGGCYYRGKGVNQDYSKALELFEKSSEQGDNLGLNWLGTFYFNGKGTEQDYIKAIELFNKTARRGNAEGQCFLAECYQDGTGVEQDYKKAIEWFEKSVAQEYTRAYYELGVCYLDGIGVETDYDKGFELFSKAAEQDSSYGEFYLGVCYFQGYSVKQDYSKAVELFNKAIELDNNSFAQNYLGYCYECGYGVEKDYEKAAEWYSKSADQGFYAAQYNLGRCYEHGWGVTQNFRKAFELYRKSAEQGYSNAESTMGNCYSNGFWVNKDKDKAIEWYIKAAKHGNEYAIKRLRELGVTEY